MRLMLGKFIFFFYLSGHHRDLHSFPTRRSSDLANALENDILGHEAWLQLSFEPEMHRFGRSEEHTSELQSRFDIVCRLLLEKKKKKEIMRVEEKRKKKRTRRNR